MIDVDFKVSYQTLAPVRSIFVGLHRFAHHFDENFLRNINIFSKSKSDYPSWNGDDFSVHHWISAPKLIRVDDSSCLFLGGGPHSHCLLYDSSSKSTLRAAMSYMTYPWWIAWENLKSSETRPYLANIRISQHSQDKSREIHFFCKFLALFCFELLVFENARSDWT